MSGIHITNHVRECWLEVDGLYYRATFLKNNIVDFNKKIVFVPCTMGVTPFGEYLVVFTILKVRSNESEDLGGDVIVVY